MSSSEYRYDVALSFAGEQRSYVKSVADHLRKNQIRLFYDEFEQSRLWGRDLVDELDEIYRTRSRYVVMFISKAYQRKQWTNHERKSALAAALKAEEEYVLPVRFDDTELKGIRPTTGYVDARKMNPEAIGKLILEKLQQKDSQSPRGEAQAQGFELWRLVQEEYADSAFEGRAGEHCGGRWHRSGTPIVYASSTLSLCLAETISVLPNNASSRRRSGWVAIGARLPGDTVTDSVESKNLPSDWASFRHLESTRKIGTRWLEKSNSCLLIVPSTVVPSERNYLLNPQHPDSDLLKIFSEEPFNLPRRLLQ